MMFDQDKLFENCPLDQPSANQLGPDPFHPPSRGDFRGQQSPPATLHEQMPNNPIDALSTTFRPPAIHLSDEAQAVAARKDVLASPTENEKMEVIARAAAGRCARWLLTCCSAFTTTQFFRGGTTVECGIRKSHTGQCQNPCSLLEKPQSIMFARSGWVGSRPDIRRQIGRAIQTEQAARE